MSAPQHEDAKETTVYRNDYVPLAELKANPVGDDTADLVIKLVESYFPGRQAVVVIEYERGGELIPEVVDVRDGFVADILPGGAS